MTLLSRTALKAFFETGDMPTQAQFADLIDSVPNFIDDNPSPLVLYSNNTPITANTATPTALMGSYTFPANTFVNDGDTAILKAWGTNAADTNVRVIAYGLGSSNPTLPESAHVATNEYWSIEIAIQFQGGTDFQNTITFIQAPDDDASATAETLCESSSISEDPTGTLFLPFAAIMPGSLASMTCEGTTVTFYKAP